MFHFDLFIFTYPYISLYEFIGTVSVLLLDNIYKPYKTFIHRELVFGKFGTFLFFVLLWLTLIKSKWTKESYEITQQKKKSIPKNWRFKCNFVIENLHISFTYDDCVCVFPNYHKSKDRNEYVKCDFRRTI